MRITANIKFKKVAKALFEGKSVAEASREAGYNGNGSSFETNARKRASHQGIRARAAELQANAAELAAYRESRLA